MIRARLHAACCKPVADGLCARPADHPGDCDHRVAHEDGRSWTLRMVPPDEPPPIPPCDRCGRPQTVYGAILYGPPGQDGKCDKRHICVSCYADISGPVPWADVTDEWSEAIREAFPTRSGSHDEYATAMKMVGNRHSKGKLVALVNWLLVLVRRGK